MKTVALGPEKDVPSWNWIGFDMCRELAKYYNVVTYESLEKPPEADIILCIKQRVTDGFLGECKSRKRKFVFVPVDFYQNIRHFRSDGHFFSKCDMIMVHCERTLNLFRPYLRNYHFVEHNNKYMLPEVAPYKEKGYILWVGGCQYTAYLVKYLRDNPIKHEIKILTDIGNGRARQAAAIIANEIEMPQFKINKDAETLFGMEVHRWSERLQFEMMSECKAAIDIKMAVGSGNFNQYHKPPTKAQKYIASGIPFAVNIDSYSHQYFKDRGFDVCQPNNPGRWLSKPYYDETVKFASKLRETTSLEAVGLRYKELIDTL